LEKLNWETKHKYNFSKEIDFLDTVLTQSGVEDIRAFLNVNEKNTFDPFLLNNINEGLDLFNSALHKKVYIKPDADVDGYTSAAYIKQFIECIAPDTEILYEMNYKKEHGLSYEEVKDIEELSLIIIPDAGSDSIEDCSLIKEHMSVPILILDHHEINPEIHNYATVVNCMDGSYPNNTLSGVGVVHKFCLAYCQKYNIDKKYCNQFLDLVSLGMIADSMDMRNLETRYYVLQGLKEGNRKNSFIQAIAEHFDEDMKMGHTIHNYGWVIAPKLNGVIRYGKPDEQKDLFRALCQEIEDREYQPRRKSKDAPIPPIEIHTLQKTMARVAGNVKSRQDTEVRKFMKEIDHVIEHDGLDKNSVIIVNGTDILTKSTAGGLVANKLTEKYRRPVIILKEMKDNPNTYGGSGRGYDKCKIKDFREFLLGTELFNKCAGHAGAFGVEIDKDKVELVSEKCNQLIKPEDLITIYPVDYEIDANYLTEEMVREVADAYEIWGNRVDEPVFVITDINICAKDITGYGDNNGFIKFNYNGIDYIKKYCLKDDFDEMTLRDRNILGINNKQLHITLIGNFTLNFYEGNRYPQVRISKFYSEEQKSKNKKTIDDDFLF